MNLKTLLKILFLAWLIHILMYAIKFFRSKPKQYCSHFKLQSSNDTIAKALSSTTVWIIGERHEERIETLRCIEDLTRGASTHTVYVESEPAGKIVSCRSADMIEKKGRTCKGWDDMAARKAVINYYKIMLPRNALLEEISNKFAQLKLFSKMPDKFLDQQLSDYINRSNAKPKVRKSTIEYLKTLRDQGMSYKEIFTPQQKTIEGVTNNYGRWFASTLADFRKNNIKRNRAMLKTLKTSLNNAFSIFVVGRGHIDDRDKDDTAGSQYTREKIRGFNTTIAVLVTKTNRPTFIRG